MHRQKLLKLLENYQAYDVEEQKMLDETIDFIKTNENCFERENQKGHLTASSWILDTTGTGKYVLLTHHRKLNKWFQPGGHCDGETDMLKVAIKECIEETGYSEVLAIKETVFDVDVHLIPARKTEPAHFHYDIRFLMEADKNLPFTVSEESNDLAWISLADVEQFNDSTSIMRMVRKSSI